MTNNEPMAPLISINKKGEAEYHSSVCTLTKPMLSIVHSGDFDEITVLSSDGRVYRMFELKIVNYVIANIYRIISYIYCPRIFVKFGSIEMITESYDEFRMCLINSVKKDEEFWSAGFEISDLVERFMQCDNPERLLATFQKIYYGIIS